MKFSLGITFFTGLMGFSPFVPYSYVGIIALLIGIILIVIAIVSFVLMRKNR